MNTSSNAQKWLDKNLYPFESKYVQLESGNMHYVDEGEGEVILLVHGTPTWSFLYRDFIKQLSINYRCIAIDHIGFGLSEKNESFSGTPQAHANNLHEFIHKLQLENITLVVHDFGGPIGLAAGIKNAQKIKQIVLFNTWLWATKEQKNVQKINKIANSWLGKFLYLHMNFSPRVLLKKGFANKKKLPKKIHTHYIKTFPTKRSRIPLLSLAKALAGSSDWYQAQWQQLDKLANKNWLIIWGTKDAFITTKHLDIWKKHLPKATIKELECGHFVQEEKTIQSIVAIKAFMEK